VVYATVVDGGDTGKVLTFDSGEYEDSILTGLTIQNGEEGIYCYYSDPLISNCVIRYNNSSGIHGSSSSPTIIDCVVRENSSKGILRCDGKIENCIVTENFSSGIDECDGTIVNCKITGNLGNGLDNCGGPIKNCTISSNSGSGLIQCSGVIQHCIISGNLSHGLYYCYGQVTNCTIIGNKGHGSNSNNSNPILSNNIIVLNWEKGIYQSATLKYNNVWGNLNGNYSGVAPGENDSHENPRFAVDGFWDTDVWVEGEYYLKSIAGRWDPKRV